LNFTVEKAVVIHQTIKIYQNVHRCKFMVSGKFPILAARTAHHTLCNDIL